MGKKVLALILAAAMALSAAPAVQTDAFAEVKDSKDSGRREDSGPIMESRVSDGLSVIPLSVDDQSLTLVWSKPENYADIQDYSVYANGKKIGRASKNKNSPAQVFFDRFYQDKENTDATRINFHNYMVTGLSPKTDYTFTVKAVMKDGKEKDLGGKYTTDATTLEKPTVIDVTSAGYNADKTGKTVCTAAIQKAIDDCPKGGTVLLPEGGKFLSGSLKLHEDMTFRVDGTLISSTDPMDCGGQNYLDAKEKMDKGDKKAKFPKKFDPFISFGSSTKKRVANVRLVGKGVIDGQGWKLEDSSPDVEYSKGDMIQSKTSNPDTILENGILAANQYKMAIDLGMDPKTAYGTRSQLVEGRQVSNIYVGNGLTLKNPSNSVLGMSYVDNYVVNGLITQSFNINNGDCINVARFQGFTALNNVVNSGDDNIVMNAGSGNDPLSGSAWIFNNYIARGHGGVAFGSGTTCDIDNVMAEDNILVGTSDGLRCKSKPGSGGGVNHVVFRDTAMRNLTNLVHGKVDGNTIGYQMDGCPFIFTTNYPGEIQKIGWPVFRNFDIYNCSVNGATTHGIIVDGSHNEEDVKAAGIEFKACYNLHFKNIRFKNTRAPKIDYLEDSSFENVIFEGVKDPWAAENLTHCNNILITNENEERTPDDKDKNKDSNKKAKHNHSKKHGGTSYRETGPASGTPKETKAPRVLKSDTTKRYSFKANKTYFYLVKTDNPQVPTAVSSNPSAVSVIFEKKVDGGYLYKITNVGPGTAVITTTAANGETTSFTATGRLNGIYSDTNAPFALNSGKSYVMKFTAENPDLNPVFTVGNGNVLSISSIVKRGNDYFVTVKAIGTTKTSSGVYCTLPSQRAALQCIVNIT